MAVKVRIPTPLQKLTNNQAEVTAEGATLKAANEHVAPKHRGRYNENCALAELNQPVRNPL